MAPLAMVTNAIVEPAAEDGVAVSDATPNAADANAAIHVHTAYNSHM